MRLAQVARVAMAGTVLGTLSTTSIAAVSLTTTPATPIPTPIVDAAAPDGRDSGTVDALPHTLPDALPDTQPPTAPVDGATIAAAGFGPALRAVGDVPVAAPWAATTPRAVPQAPPTVRPEAGVVETPVVRERPRVHLPRGVRAQVRLACARDLLDAELCGWVQHRSSTR